MKYHPIDSALFVKNRSNFMAQMKANSLAVFNSNDIYPISADSTIPFQQHRDIYYLSGVDHGLHHLSSICLYVAERVSYCQHLLDRCRCY